MDIPSSEFKPLTPEEAAAYEWQLNVPDFGHEGQRRLKAASVLVSRAGGAGGTVAQYLAVAGVGKIVLAHGGNLRPDDLNRQILMAHDGIGKPRVDCAVRRLRELNPRIEIEAVNENVSESNIAALVGKADLIADCAPLFSERLLMNRESVRQRKPMVECAMFELESHLTTFVPHQTPCLTCLYPVEPPAWRRKFPVFGAVAGMIGALAAMEAIKVLAGFGEPLLGRLLTCDLRSMTFGTFKIHVNTTCAVCGEKTV